MLPPCFHFLQVQTEHFLSLQLVKSLNLEQTAVKIMQIALGCLNLKVIWGTFQQCVYNLFIRTFQLILNSFWNLFVMTG